MANKEYQMLFKLSAQVGREFGSAFSSAQQQMSQIQKEVNALNQAQSDISAYTKQQTAVDNTKRKLEDLQKQYDNIQREYEETGESSSTLANKMIDKQRAIDQTTQKLEQQTQKLDQMETELKEAGIDTDNLGDEQAKLAKQLDDAADEMKDLADGADQYGTKGVDAFEAVGSALVAAGIAEGLKELAEAYKECIELSMTFHSSMSNVEALSGATADEMEALTAQAKELGATTKFTATEAADAMGYMGMAGWSAEQMLAGMPGVLSLAAASGEDLSRVSDIVTDSMTAFGLTAKDTNRYADILAATAANANTNVSMMGETFKVVAPLAGALGYDVEDMAIATGILANSGVKASEAGTSLRGILTRLAKPTKESQDAMDALGISLTDDSGRMYSFMEIMEQMRDSFAGLTEDEQAFYAAELAGQRGMTGLLTIVNAAEEDFATLSDKITNCEGAAQKMADVKMDNLQGEMTLLNSATDALKTTIGEAYDNEFQGLVKVITQIVTGINDFLTKHPVILKSLIAITAEAGAFLAVYAAYQTYKKLSIALEPILIALKQKEAAATAAANAQLLLNPYVAVAAAVVALTVGIIALVEAQDKEAKELRGLTSESREQYSQLQELNAEYENAKEAYGENSEEAQLLRWQVERLSAEYEAGKQSVEEYREETQQMVNDLSGTVAAYQNSITEIDRQEVASLALVHRLEELAGQVSRTAAEEDEMKAIIAELNEQFPELNLSLEKLSENQPNFIETVENMVKAEAAARRNEAAVETMVDAYGKIDVAEKELVDANADLDAATERAQRAEEVYMGMYGSVEGLGAVLALLTPEYKEWKAALNEEDAAQERVDGLTASLTEAQAAYQGSRSELEAYYEAQQAADATEQAFNETVSTTVSKMEELTEAYTTAYDAALESVQGQYSLWDEAGEVESTSIDKINSALESQAQHWADYQANLDTLNAKTGEVEGLSEVIASFADGSDESVAAIAGMASASTEDLQTMVDNYKKVQESQGEVSDSLANLTTEFQNKMDELQRNLEEDVAKMDMSAEAAANGKATIDAFAAEAENSYSRVYNAYAAIRQAAMSALNGSGSSNGGYAEGTESATRGVHLVGEEGPELVYFEGGEKVIPASETASLMQNVQPLEAMPAESAAGGDGGGFNVALTINVTGSGDAGEQVQAAGESLRAQLESMLEDYMSERDRRVYR